MSYKVDVFKIRGFVLSYFFSSHFKNVNRNRGDVIKGKLGTNRLDQLLVCVLLFFAIGQYNS